MATIIWTGAYGGNWSTVLLFLQNDGVPQNTSDDRYWRISADPNPEVTDRYPLFLDVASL